MKKSIKIKLFIVITCFSILIIGLSWFFNAAYLEKYYLKRKKENLIHYGEIVKKDYKSEDILFQLEEIENNINGNITILNNKGTIKYTSFMTGRNNKGMSGFTYKYLKDNIKDLSKGKEVLDTFIHPNFNTKFLIYMTHLKNGDYLILQSSIASIKEGVNIAKDFHIYIGLISLIIAIIIAYIFSKVIIKPIIRLNDITKNMAKLDFSDKFSYKSDDEIGELGKNINYLSDKLDKTINELNKANKDLKKDIEKEKKLEMMRKEFISSVSHELKTPISLVQGFAEGLKDNVNEDRESKDYYCDVIIDETKNMEKLVKDLLDLSKLQLGKFKLKKEKINLIDVVESVINKYKKVFNERDINFRFKNNLREIYVLGDELRLRQVLINYINNALNHIDERKEISIKITKNNSLVRVCVKNSGNNISKEETEKIWDSFYKVDKSRNRKYGTTGLGLSIVKGIINLHNGHYGVINKKDGVEFYIKLSIKE
ncbi:MAG: HAMP domain-containing histidine kinase [Firmicutes bacterium]|nr:HAMP domain-containing histidine kinase [Bacillota bacterium]